jgi:glucosamine-6-phosphate deaminase
MQVLKLPSANTAASAAADLVVDTLGRIAAPVLGLPTGRTAVPLYEALVARHRAGQADFARAVTFNLDEFAGLPADHPGSYHTFMREHLFQHVNLAPNRTHLLRGSVKDWRAEMARYERRLADLGGLDLAILGIGLNGHIAFNEPAPALIARTHRVRLAPSTRRANAASGFNNRWQKVPTHALSMGIGTILSARRVILVATGAHKASIVARALTGPVTTRVPASLLQVHPDVVVVLDRAAATRLPRQSPTLRSRGRGTPAAD